VLKVIEAQLHRCSEKIRALFLVGGFSSNDYMFHRVEERFSSTIPLIFRPDDADKAACLGAAQFGLTARRALSNIMWPKAYMFKVELPAEEEDKFRRPAYVYQAPNGRYMCRNRLKYLVHKDAIVQRGQKVKVEFGKRSTSPQDKMFVVQVFLFRGESSVEVHG